MQSTRVYVLLFLCWLITGTFIFSQYFIDQERVQRSVKDIKCKGFQCPFKETQEQIDSFNNKIKTIGEKYPQIDTTIEGVQKEREECWISYNNQKERIQTEYRGRAKQQLQNELSSCLSAIQQSKQKIKNFTGQLVNKY